MPLEIIFHAFLNTQDAYESTRLPVLKFQTHALLENSRDFYLVPKEICFLSSCRTKGIDVYFYYIFFVWSKFYELGG